MNSATPAFTTLIVSASPQAADRIAAWLGEDVAVGMAASEDTARRLMHAGRYGLLIVNAPLPDGDGEALCVAHGAGALMRAAQAQLTRMEARLSEVRVVERAKWALTGTLGMTEAQAHRYIEKQAMDTRRTKRAVAEQILRTYEN